MYTGHKSPRPRTHTPTGTPTFIPQDSLLFSSAPASSGYIITQPVVSSGIIRPLAQVPRQSKNNYRGTLGHLMNVPLILGLQ